VADFELDMLVHTRSYHIQCCGADVVGHIQLGLCLCALVAPADSSGVPGVYEVVVLCILRMQSSHAY
jgi:hypothetical protein